MSHPSDQTLQSYGLGKLDDPEAEAVDRHLEDCPDCRRRVGEMSSDSFLGRLRGAQAATEPPSAVPDADGAPSAVGTAPAPGRPGTEALPGGLDELTDYTILRELGRGGMGVVYLAHNRLMGRDEVLKVIDRQIMERPEVLDRFLREIRAVAKLRHPNIVTAYSAFRLGESIVFAMEHVDGLDLARLVRARGPLPVGHACYFTHQAALGLGHAQEEGMVHRDIKPGNLMLARMGQRAVVKVLDFGLAKATREEEVDGSLTQDGQMLGTPAYIAPEQTVDAQKADIRADIYSLGCTLYFLLTGGPPFRGPSLYDILQAHQSTEATPLDIVRPDVPAELAWVVAKMMAKDPDRRYQTPDEVARALAPFFSKAGRGREGSTPVEPMPARSATIPFGPGPTSQGLNPPAPAPGAGTTARKPRSGTTWEGLIEFGDTERPGVTPTADGPARRPSWGTPALLAVGAVLLGFVGVWSARVFEANPAAVPVEDVSPAPAPGHAVAAAPRSRGLADDGFVPLFNGRDLTGWVVDRGDPDAWHFEGGVLTIEAPTDRRAQTLLLTERDFSDFLLRFEFQLPRNTDSGVILRALPGEPGLHLEVNLRNFDEPASLTGALVWTTARAVWPSFVSDRPAVLNPGVAWNAMEIESYGDSLRVAVNGQDVLRRDLRVLAGAPGAIPALRRPSGRIGFQGDTGTVRFRGVRLKELRPGPT
jgi:serine/threonine protein kinase